MARDAEMHARLLQWGQLVTVGDGSGYPSMSVLHKEWQPPTPGLTPSMKTSAPNRARETHHALGFLSLKLRNTVVLVYCMNLSAQTQALRLGCSVRTVANRIEEAQRQLRQRLEEAHEERVFANFA